MSDQDVCGCGHARGVHTKAGECRAGGWMREKMLRAGEVPCACVAFVLNPDPKATLRPITVKKGRIVR